MSLISKVTRAIEVGIKVELNEQDIITQGLLIDRIFKYLVKGSLNSKREGESIVIQEDDETVVISRDYIYDFLLNLVDRGVIQSIKSSSGLYCFSSIDIHLQVINKSGRTYEW